MRISIVTPSFNQGRFIRRTIDSVLGQAGAFDLDYLVVDGGSTDETLDVLRSYGPRVRWTSEPDRGQSDAINKGFGAVTGDVLGWLNSDDVLMPGALDRVARTFAADPTCAWLHGRCEIIDEHDRPVRRWVSLYKHLRARRHSLDNLLTENYISQMTVFWRRSAMDATGPLDLSLSYAFDYDLWLRLARLGPPRYLDDPIACFRWYETSKSGARYREQFREDEAVAARHAGSRPFILARKRAKNLAIVGIYRLLAAARRAAAPARRA
jgi:glycosyltransferase involved in cell wall biosynthesis